jgi:hypothetical protein
MVVAWPLYRLRIPADPQQARAELCPGKTRIGSSLAK